MGAYAMPVNPEFQLMEGMSDHQRSIFVSQYSLVRKDPAIAVLLAFVLGSFGAHRFYLGETSLGVLYLCFFWTGIPGLVSLVECFLLPDRVRRYNTPQAVAIAAGVRGGPTAAYPGAMVPR